MTRRFVSFAHRSMSGQFQQGLPPTVHRGSGNPSLRYRHWSSAERVTPMRSAISITPTGSHSMRKSVSEVLTPGQGCGHNTYMTTTHEIRQSRYGMYAWYCCSCGSYGYWQPTAEEAEAKYKNHRCKRTTAKVQAAWTERDGRQVRAGWQVIDAEGNWVQTFATRREAKEVAEALG